MAPRTLFLKAVSENGVTQRCFRLFRNTLASLLMTLSVSAHASVTTDATLPSVSVMEGGELVLQSGDIHYTPWQSQQLTGKVYVIQHMAGRTSAKELNAPLIDRIKAAELPKDRYQTVTVVNTDDAIWGTGGIVKGKLESSKEEFPWSMMVLDQEGVARSVWDLQEESSAIIVVDAENRVRWMKDGALNDQEQQEVMDLIQTLLK
ncbi:YtfJ family protein [Oceanospirillum sanctuarii]|uniref:YtfJ family protein n=1 Tax=Oceanospirillum sanctuarii TaxID=1434821 RepID=UPI001C3D8CD9|nr:YtfJ family protein [Oceanospirillum sanctuarii]